MDTFEPGPRKRKKPRKGPTPNSKPKTPGQLYLEEQQKLNEEKKEKERMERFRPKPSSLPPLKKGGSIIKGSSLRKQASTKGLRTSKKHK